jgi:plastocyanin
MRKVLLLLTVAAALVAPQSSFAATTKVSITRTGFHPAAVTVASGDTVTWTNNDSTRHQVVAETGSFSSPVLAPNQSYSHVFTAGGTFAYRDAVHPSLHAAVTVIPPRTVWIMRNGFVPATISIKAGQSVRWVNKTAANHQVVADDSSFSSPVLAQGNAFAHAFTSGGTHRYHDGLQPSVSGTVVVTATATESIALAASTHVVTYGGSVVFTGKVTNGTAGEKVTLAAKPQTGDDSASTETVTTGADGTFRVRVRPLVQTAYTAAAANSTSSPVVINVRPRVRLGAIGHRRAVVRVSAARGFLHKYALVQRWNARRHVWRSVRRVRFTRTTVATASTVVTSARFRHAFRAGVRLRVFVPRSQVMPGYTSNVSNAVRVS